MPMLLPSGCQQKEIEIYNETFKQAVLMTEMN